MFISALARRPSIQMRFLCVQMCSRSTPVDPNAFLMCSNALSLDACRSKCVSMSGDPSKIVLRSSVKVHVMFELKKFNNRSIFHQTGTSLFLKGSRERHVSPNAGKQNTRAPRVAKCGPAKHESVTCRQMFASKTRKRHVSPNACQELTERI